MYSRRRSVLRPDQRGHLGQANLAFVQRVDHHRVVGQPVVVLAPLLHPAALQPGGVVVGHVGGGLTAEQVERDAVVEVQVLLDHLQRDDAERGHVVGVVLHHDLSGAGHHPVHPGGAHHHVVGLLLEHELTRPGQRVERALLQRAELVLAVPVGEVREHVERQPVRGLLVERAEDAGRVLAARVAVQQLLGLIPPFAAEVGLQQVDHGPQVPPLLHVDLEQVAQVVQGRRGGAQVALLLYAGRLGVALDDQQPLQVGAVLARDLLPGGLAPVLAEGDAPAGVALGQEDAPPVVLHGHVPEVGPAFAADVDRGPQVHVLGGQGRPHRLPPVQEVRLPGLQRPLQPPVLAQLDVVGDLLGVVRCCHRFRLAFGRSRPAARCRNGAARRPGRRRSAE